MILTNLIAKVLLENINPILQQLRDKYVGEGKLFSEEEFKKLEDVAGNKWYLIAWLTKRVATNLIKKEDVYKWKEYFQIFEKNKKKFKFQDLNQYKTAEDIKYLIETVVEIREGDTQFEDIPKSNSFLSKNEIEKLTAGGNNKYLGFYKPEKGLKVAGKDGYQVFQITEVSKENWKIYRDLLGRCKGRERGAKIEICTIGDYHYFKQYLKDPKGSHYIVLFNLNDPLSPYQLHVESNQFMNKNDVERYNFDPEDFLKWLSKKSSDYDNEKIAKFMGKEVPHKDKGYEDENGKQGVWLKYDDGYLESIRVYKNNKTDGPAKEFRMGGKIFIDGTLKNERWVGDYVQYDGNGNIYKKGFIGPQGQPKGLWRYRDFHSGFKTEYVLVDHDNPEFPVSAFTKNDVLKVLADKADEEIPFYGKILVVNPSGSVRATGRLTPTGKKTGPWTIYNPDGSIKLEGNFKNNEPAGEWTFFFKWKSEPHLYVYNFDTREKGKVYTKKGEFVKKLPYYNEKVPSVRKFFEF